MGRVTADSPMGRIARNTGWMLGGKAVGAVLSLAYLALATRTLGATNFGIFTLILASSQFITRLVTFDSWQAIVKYGHKALNERDPEGLARLVGTTLSIDLLSAVVGTAIAVVVALVLGPLLGWDREVQRWAILYSAVALFAIRSTPVGLLRLADKFSAGAVADTMTPITRMVGASIAAFYFQTVPSFLIAWAASEVAVAASYWILAYRYGRAYCARPKPSALLSARKLFPGLGKFLVATNLNVTLSSLASQGPILLVGSFAGVAEAGFYRLASQLSNALVMVAQLLSRTIFAEMARSHARVDRHVGKRELMTTLKHTLVISVSGAAVVIFCLVTLGQPLLLLMSGPAFLPAYSLLLLLGIAAAVDFGGLSFSPMLMAADRAHVALRVRVTAIVLMFALMAWLLPAKGATGAAIAVLATSIVQLVLIAFVGHRTITRYE